MFIQKRKNTSPLYETAIKRLKASTQEFIKRSCTKRNDVKNPVNIYCFIHINDVSQK